LGAMAADLDIAREWRGFLGVGAEVIDRPGEIEEACAALCFSLPAAGVIRQTPSADYEAACCFFASARMPRMYSAASWAFLSTKSMPTV